MSQQSLSLLEFASHVGVMKPNSLDKKDPRKEEKLNKLLEDPNYALEEKWDGCRYVTIGSNFFSSDHVEKTDNFPHLRDFFKQLAMHNLILDGEIYYPGKTSQYCTHVTGGAPSTALHFQQQNGFIHYMVYDILRTPKGNWTIRNTYVERRKLLVYFYNTFIKGKDIEKYIHIGESWVHNKKEIVEGILEAGREGGVLKKLDSQYYMGKKPMWQWMKVKQEDDTDLVIIGFEAASVQYEGDNIDTHKYWMDINGVKTPVTKFHYNGWIGSVVFGAYVNGVLTRLCTASGMAEDVRIDMTNNPEKYLNKVARVTFMEKTADGYPRHPVFKNLHETKMPSECVWEFE